MPPPARPRPNPATYERFVTWLETELDQAAARNPNPGRTEAFHRLNRTEYHHAVRDLLDVEVDVAELLPADGASYGFDNIAGVLGVSPTLVERYLAAARRISRIAVGRPAPSATAEVHRLPSDLGDGGFDAGIEMALRWLLASPEFVLRVERDPAGSAPGSTYPVSDLELASRLSSFLWSSIPDDELLDAAVAGRLRDPVELERQTRRMLADDRARALVTSFASQWRHLRNVPAVVPDEDRFPDVGEALRRAMRRETKLFVDSDCRWRGALDARGHRAPPRQSGLRELPPADALIAGFVCRNARGERYARPPVWLLAGTLGLSVVIFAGDRLFTEAPDSPLASAAIVALAQYGIPTGMFLVGRTAGTWLAPRLRVYAQLAEYLRVMWIPIGGFAAGYLAIILVFAGFCGTLERFAPGSFAGAAQAEIGDWISFSFFSALTQNYSGIAPASVPARMLVGIQLILSVGPGRLRRRHVVHPASARAHRAPDHGDLIAASRALSLRRRTQQRECCSASSWGESARTRLAPRRVLLRRRLARILTS